MSSIDVGDLITLDQPWAQSDQGGWGHGTNARTRLAGDFPVANIYVLPCVTRPPDRLLALFKNFFAVDDDAA